MNNYFKILCIIFFCSKSSFGQQIYLDSMLPKIEFSLKLNFDTLSIKENNIIKINDNLITLKNNSNQSIKVTNYIYYSYYDFQSFKNIITANSSFKYFPVLEFYNNKYKNWSKLNFYSMQNSSEPNYILTPFDSMTYLKPNSVLEFKNNTFLDLINLSKDVLYRVKLVIVIEVNKNTMLLKHTNYCNFYVKQ